MMTKEELKDFLKENLKIELGKEFYDNNEVLVKIYLKLGDEIISENSFWTKKGKCISTSRRLND